MSNTQILSPVGRMVQGHPFEANDKNMKGGPLTDKNGNPRTEYFFAVAFPKTDPGMAEVLQTMQATAQAGFPGGQSQWPAFSWKLADGDQPPHNAKEGFPGCYVLKFKSGFQPKVYTKGGAAQIVEASQIKRGDFVRVYFSVAANNDLQKPGLFVNPAVVELVGYGEEISTGPGGDIFAQQPVAQLPAGASATPTAGPPIAAPAGFPGAPAGPPMPGSPGSPPMPGGFPAGPGSPPMPGGFPGAPAGPVAPAPDFLNPPPAAPTGPTMTAKAAGATRGQFHAQGWTDEQLVAHGYMVA